MFISLLLIFVCIKSSFQTIIFLFHHYVSEFEAESVGSCSARMAGTQKGGMGDVLWAFYFGDFLTVSFDEGLKSNLSKLSKRA